MLWCRLFHSYALKVLRGIKSHCDETLIKYENFHLKMYKFINQIIKFMNRFSFQITCNNYVRITSFDNCTEKSMVLFYGRKMNGI